MVTLNVAAVPDGASLLKQTNTSFGNLYEPIDLATDFFFLNPVNKDHQKRFVFSWQSQQYSFTVLPPRYINPPGLCHNLLPRQFDHLSLLQDFILAHYVDAITQIGPNE